MAIKHSVQLFFSKLKPKVQYLEINYIVSKLIRLKQIIPKKTSKLKKFISNPIFKVNIKKFIY